MKRRITVFILVIALALQLWAAAADTATVFADVQKSDWFYKNGAINYVYNNNLFKGTGKTTFAPNAPMTRAMFVTVLGRLDGAQVRHSRTSLFTDVDYGKYYTGYVCWAADNGIVYGVSALKFAPDEQITREQICVMLTRYCAFAQISLQATKPAVTFVDRGSISKYAKTSVALCQRSGLISGEKVAGGYRFRPLGNATRAEVATILMNFDKAYGAIHQWDTVQTTQQNDCVHTTVYGCSHCSAQKTVCDAQHVYVVRAGVEPTCTTAGRAIGIHCDRCRRVFARDDTLPATGHSWVAATCTTPKYCRNCYIIIQNPLGHKVSNNRCTRCGVTGTIYDDPPYGTVRTSCPSGNFSDWYWGQATITYTWKIDEYGGYWASSSTMNMTGSEYQEWLKYAEPYTGYPERDGAYEGEQIVKEAWVWLKK